MCGGGGGGCGVGSLIEHTFGLLDKAGPLGAFGMLLGAPALAGLAGLGGAAAGAGLGEGLGSLGSSALFSLPGEAASALGGTGLFSLPADLAAGGLGTLGAAEGALGGAAMFGPFAGTGTALGGDLAGALGGGALGAGLGMATGGDLGGSSLFTLPSETGGFPGENAPGAVPSPVPTPSPIVSDLGGPTPSFGGAGDLTGGGALTPNALGPNNLSAGIVGQGADTSGLGTTGGFDTSGGLGAGGYSPNTMAFGPNVPTPESGGMFGVTPMSTEASNVANLSSGAFRQPTFLESALNPLVRARSAVNDFLSPIGGIQGAQLGVRGLQSLYGAYQQRQLNAAQNQQLAQLNDLFSPTGAYAQQLRQQLERRDAAAGRRSQYGDREVELAAKLAQAKAQVIGGQTYTGLNQAAARSGSGGLNSLFGNLGQMMGLTGPQIGGGNEGMGTVTGGRAGVPNVIIQMPGAQ